MIFPLKIFPDLILLRRIRIAAHPNLRNTLRLFFICCKIPDDCIIYICSFKERRVYSIFKHFPNGV